LNIVFKFLGQVVGVTFIYLKSSAATTPFLETHSKAL